MRLAIAISTATRSSVMKPSTHHVADLPHRHIAVDEGGHLPQCQHADAAPAGRTRGDRRSARPSCRSARAPAGAAGARRGFMPARSIAAKARPMNPRKRERRIMVSAQELLGVSPASCSSRNQSALAISGRNSS